MSINLAVAVILQRIFSGARRIGDFDGVVEVLRPVAQFDVLKYK